MGEPGCVCRPITAGPLAGAKIRKIGCPVHDGDHPRALPIRFDAGDSSEAISRDIDQERVPGATEERASCASPPCAAAQPLSNVGAAASFSGVLGSVPSGPIWDVKHDSEQQRIIVLGMGQGFGLDLTAARLLHHKLGVALDLRSAGG